MRIGWVSFHAEAIPALQAVTAAGHDVVGCVTLTPEAAAKRSAVHDPAPLCAARGIPVHRTKHVNDPETVAFLRGLHLDLLVVLGWSQLLSEEVLKLPRVGTVGAHASLLPRGRGRAPVNWALLRGWDKTGNTLMWLAPGVDEGDVIAQREIPLTPFDTCGTVYERVAATNAEMLTWLLDELAAGRVPRTPQPHVDDEPLPGRKPADGLIPWHAPAEDVYALVRAVTRPYPGAFSYLDGARHVVWSAALLPLRSRLGRPGEVIGPVYSPEEAACGQAVACGEGAVVLLEVEDEAGRVLRGRELATAGWQGRGWADA